MLTQVALGIAHDHMEKCAQGASLKSPEDEEGDSSNRQNQSSLKHCIAPEVEREESSTSDGDVDTGKNIKIDAVPESNKGLKFNETVGGYQLQKYLISKGLESPDVMETIFGWYV